MQNDCVPASVVRLPSSSPPPALPAALMNASSLPAEPRARSSSPPGPEPLPCSSPHTFLSDPPVQSGFGWLEHVLSPAHAEPSVRTGLCGEKREWMMPLRDHLSESFIAVYLLNWLLCAVVGVLDLLHLTASLTLWSWPKRPERRPPAAGHKQASYGSSPEPVLKDRERNNTRVRRKRQEVLNVLNSWAVNSRHAAAPEPLQTHRTKPVIKT